jgi:hypothetical protein
LRGSTGRKRTEVEEKVQVCYRNPSPIPAQIRESNKVVLRAQERGRETVFESYDIAVCEQVRRYGFTKERGRFETQ